MNDSIVPESGWGGIDHGLQLPELSHAAEATRAQQNLANAPQEDPGWWESVGATMSTGATGRRMEQWMNWTEGNDRSDYDPDFDPLAEVSRLQQQFNISLDDNAKSILMSSRNADNMTYLAARLELFQEDVNKASQRWTAGLVGSVGDPIQFGIDGATFGATRTMNLTRRAIAGATAGTGVVAAGHNEETTLGEYLASAAITAGAFTVFGRAAQRAAQAAPQASPLNVRHIYSRLDDDEMARRVDAGAVDDPDVLYTASQAASAGQSPGWAVKLNRQLSETDNLAVTDEAAAIISPLVDDPVRRPNLLKQGNAASSFRLYSAQLREYGFDYDEAVQQGTAQLYGTSRHQIADMVDLGGKRIAARDAFEKQVIEELAYRDNYTSLGQSPPPRQNVPEAVRRAADKYDAWMEADLKLAKRAGLEGAESFDTRSGYFRRNYNYNKMAELNKVAGKHASRDILAQAILEGSPWLTESIAKQVAGKIVDRTGAKALGTRADFLGALGKGPTDDIRRMLSDELGDMGEDIDDLIQSIMSRIETVQAEKSTVNFAKGRIRMDMATRYRAPDGNSYSVLDLIDTDLGRLGSDYTNSLAGRSALAKAGIGGTDASIEAFRKRYAESISHLDKAQVESSLRTFDAVMGDFTGIRPDRNVLSPMAQTSKTMIQASMLPMSGAWQVLEYPRLAQVFGMLESNKALIRKLPVVRNLARDTTVAEDFWHFMNIDLANDVRLRPYRRQLDDNLALNDSAMARLWYSAKQATPYINGMKYIHAHQARATMNLSIDAVINGILGSGRRADRLLSSYAPNMDRAAIRRVLNQDGVVTVLGGRVDRINWSLVDQETLDTLAEAALRIADSTVLHQRPGQGATLLRGQLGQTLGMFRSYVSDAHNKILRGGINQDGIGSLALLAAYQFPLSFMMQVANEARKGNEVDLDDPDTVRKLTLQAFTYLGAMGWVTEAANIVGLNGHGRGGLGTAFTTVLDPAWYATKSVGQLIDEDGSVGGAAKDGAQAFTRLIPGAHASPFTRVLLDSLGDD